MGNTPIFWKTSLEDISQSVENLKKGKVVMQAESAGGRPVQLIAYGKKNDLKRSANLSSALGAGNKSFYADKSAKEYRPTLLLVGSVHGGEVEGVAALLNLINILETGVDFKGERNEFLSKAAETINILIIPCLNPDGRNRFPFESMVGKTLDELRYYNQGTWKDGTLCGWPGCKQIHPIKEHCDFLGAYFNDDGINLMHDDFFGKKAAETQFLFDVADEYSPDFTILLHGAGHTSNAILKTAYAPDAVKKKIISLEETIKLRCDEEGLCYFITSADVGENKPTPCSFNLISALYHHCGEPCVTYESNQGVESDKGFKLTFEQMYRSHIILFEQTIKHIEEKEGENNEN